MTTSREAVEAFLGAWRDRDWALMSRYCQATWIEEKSNPTAWLAGFFGQERYATEADESFGINFPTEMDPLVLTGWVWDGRARVNRGLINADVFHIHKVRLRTSVGTRRVEFNVICEDGPYAPSPTGRWGVNPPSGLRGLYSANRGVALVGSQDVQDGPRTA